MKLQFSLAFATIGTVFGATCNPDFQNYKLSISNGYGIEWAPATLTSGSAIVAQNNDAAIGEFFVVKKASGEYIFR